MSNGEKAWKLGKIIRSMNDEGAYYGSWLYIWPDEESYEECLCDFESDEDYECLEKAFICAYKGYHPGGLYRADDETVKEAHRWDDKLGLKPIENIF